jgi:ABC-type nitrate/sulfonate/bicarbonate transport system substrate-binding protein
MQTTRNLFRTTALAVLYLLGLAIAVSSAQAARSFSDLVGSVAVGPVKSGPLQVPFLTWGGDVATFYANGGLSTTADSIYGKLGLDIELVPGDDFVGQVRNYLKGESPILRGTVRMIGMATEAVSRSPGTEPVMFLQLTWSAGDHLVSRGDIKTLSDLKGKKIVLQQGGPHVGMLDDVLKAARLSWNDVDVIWVDDLTGPNGAAARFRQDPSIGAALVITPDMLALTGGLNERGSGKNGTVADARVLVSTAQMSRSIADVYAVRKDYFDAHRDQIERFAAGYLKASEELVGLKKAFEKGGSDAYRKILQMTQDIYGKEVIPTLEEGAHGLISDASFVGLPGNVSFFTDAGNLSGFKPKTDAALKLAVDRGFASSPGKIANANLDYEKLASLTAIQGPVKETAPAAKFAEMSPTDLFPDDPVKRKAAEDNIILTFTVNFEPNQSSFTAAQYGDDFQRALEAASTFGNAVIAIGGHADPTLMLRYVVEAGMAKGNLSRTGSPGDYQYTLDGRPFDLADPASVQDAIKAGKFSGGGEKDPMRIMKALEELSQDRAEAVKTAIVDYANAKGYRLDVSQIQPVGVGAREPLVAKPTTVDEARQNMRVEFRLMKVPVEAISTTDFNF